MSDLMANVAQVVLLLMALACAAACCKYPTPMPLAARA
jgi:hypothetical protein